jgi:hypothetical protein
MRRRGWWLLACGVLLAVFDAGLAVASAGPPVFPIAGFAANGLQVGGVSRLNDGGALIAGSLSDEAGSPQWRPVVVRLLLDGSVDLGYGTEGVSTPRIGRDTRATSLATDPQTGSTWIGVAGPHRQGAIVALNGEGFRYQRFGRHGILGLGAANAPVALARQPGQLLVASGTQPCTGCQLTLVDTSTGAVIAGGALTPQAFTGSARCTGGAITSAVFLDSRTAQLVFLGARHCAAQLVAVAIARRNGHISLRATTTAPLGASTTTALIAAFGSNICLATSGPTSTAFGPLLASRQAFTQSRAPGGQLIAVVALGQGACAALITNGRQPGAFVVQASVQQRHATRDAVPRSVQPLGMFRCHAHLVVIGARAQNHGRRGTVVVIPVRRGPKITTASVTVAKRNSTRCS